MCLIDSPMNSRVEYRNITIYFGAVLKGVDIAGINWQDVCQVPHSETMTNCKQIQTILGQLFSTI